MAPPWIHVRQMPGQSPFPVATSHSLTLYLVRQGFRLAWLVACLYLRCGLDRIPD